MKDLKNHRDFNIRPSDEREWLLENTWCDFCKKADLGMVLSTEYELNGKIYLSGFCKICGNKIISEISDLTKNK
jgi:hypothetical protein